MRQFTPVIVAALFAAAPAVATAEPSNFVIYEVKRGDTLIDLSNKYFVRAGEYRTVQRANGVANPNLLPVGMRLRINRDLLKFRPATAQILSVRGNVTVGRGGASSAATAGMAVGENATLRTAASSFASLQLEDGSRISLPSNSDVRITRLRKYVLGSSIDYDFAVSRGGLQSKVAKTKSPDDRYQVRTPKAVSAVRGTDFQSRISETTGNDFAEVVEGGLAVGAASGKAQAVAAGSGLAVAENGQVFTEALLPAPEIDGAGKMQMKQKLRFAYGTGAMRVSLASDAGFVDSFADLASSGGAAEFDNVEDGNYFVRFKAISETGFEGMPRTYAFKRRLNDVSGTAGKADNGYAFKWVGAGKGTIRYHFQLHRGETQSTPIADEAGLTGTQITLSDLLPGDYYWRVASVQFLDGEATENWTEFEKLTVSAP